MNHLAATDGKKSSIEPCAPAGRFAAIAAAPVIVGSGLDLNILE
jgi:hypothetical protein